MVRWPLSCDQIPFSFGELVEPMSTTSWSNKSNVSLLQPVFQAIFHKIWMCAGDFACLSIQVLFFVHHQFGDKNSQQLLVCWRKRLPHWLRLLRDLSNAHNLVALLKDSLGVPACWKSENLRFLSPKRAGDSDIDLTFFHEILVLLVMAEGVIFIRFQSAFTHS